ncbi:MAG: insulinase family protein [Deltaproteobacteria bacterium]|nr:insulinase family protein [Deltaproteobacteria bacterium]
MKRLLATATLLAAATHLGCAGAKPVAEQPVVAGGPATEVPMPAPSPAPAKLGGKLVTVPSPGLPLVVIRVAFQAGSVDDPKGKEGLTALTADLLAEGGTQELSSGELIEALFPMAADISVATDKEITVFSGTVHRDHAERYIGLLVAALTRPRWDPKELERLREDAVQSIEKGLRTSADEALGKAALDLVMWPKGHPYAHYTGGTVQGLKSLTLEDSKAQAARVFSQDRMLVGIGGAVDEAVVAALTSGLKALPATGAELVALPAPAAERSAMLVQKGAQSTAISMGYPWALKRGEPDFYPMMLAVSALGEHRQFNGRLMKELRVKRGLNYGDYAYVESFAQEGGTTYARLNVPRRQQSFSVWLRPVATENELFAIRAALHQIDRYRAEGMTQQELDSTRGFLEGYTLLWQQTPMRRLGYAMDDVLNGTPGFLEGFRKSLGAMTVEQVNAAIRRWIDPGALRMAVVTQDAEALKKAMEANTGSTIKYVAEKPDPEVLAEDQKFVGRPIGLKDRQLEVRPAEELFER